MGADSLRDIYIVTMQARNTQDTVDSSDSFVLYVYKSGALDIVVDGQKADGLLMDNSQNPAVNQTTTENVEKVREEANLQSTVGINSGDLSLIHISMGEPGTYVLPVASDAGTQTPSHRFPG